MKYFLIINSGSSSLKVKIYDEQLKEAFAAILEKIGSNHSFLDYTFGKRINFSSGVKDHAKALKEIIKIIPAKYYWSIKLVGHRVVHGGDTFVSPIVINQNVLKQIGRYNLFAPVHNPINIKTAQAALSEWPRLKQVAVFDTQFYKDLAPEVYLYSLPIKYYRKFRVRKYGFHGLSHEYMLEQAKKHLGKNHPNVITCHLGQGVSLTAIRGGKVLDTSMGLSPLSGATMLTRSGDLDPYIPLFMIKELKMTPEAVLEELNYHSGIKGLAGTGDFRELLLMAGEKVPDFKNNITYSQSKKKMAKLALKIYLYDIQRYLAGFASQIGRVDAVVFSGGVGQNRPDIRSAIINGVHFISRPKIIVVKANEELMIARKIKGM